MSLNDLYAEQAEMLGRRIRELETKVDEAQKAAVTLSLKLGAAEAALTPEQCRLVVAELESREWSGLTGDDIRMIDKLISDARSGGEKS